jgi:hypothetical protein
MVVLVPSSSIVKSENHMQNDWQPSTALPPVASPQPGAHVAPGYTPTVPFASHHAYGYSMLPCAAARAGPSARKAARAERLKMAILELFEHGRRNRTTAATQILKSYKFVLSLQVFFSDAILFSIAAKMIPGTKKMV